MDDLLFLGFDSSTQGLKATLIDKGFRVVREDAVNYDNDLPGYRTSGGVHQGEDGLTVTAPPLMWAEALDLLLERMRDAGWPLGRVCAISGSGQQHGSVWMRAGTDAVLSALAPERSLKDQLADIFTLDESPIWMDASTRAECEALERALGGAQRVADITGSRAYERFTGNQIAKVFRTQPERYRMTERISLVSSFMASLLAGRVVPIDTSDGSGMNLLDIRTRRWSPDALDATAPDLEARLGNPVPAHTIVGSIHAYAVRRYGFSPDCRVIAFSGDNPNSLAGLRLQTPGQVAISLGTSDTMFGSVDAPRPSGQEGHVFASPIDPDAFMVMLVHQNGSLAREQIRDRFADGSWDVFSKALSQTPPGNGGRMGLYWMDPEISPPTSRTGIFRQGAGGEPVDTFPPDAEIRAIVESQLISFRMHGEAVGMVPSRLLATGGGAANREIVQVMADVFAVPVWGADQTASASLGAAYRALHGWRCTEESRFVPFAEALADAPAFRKLADPDRQAHTLYTESLPRWRTFEKESVAN